MQAVKEKKINILKRKEKGKKDKENEGGKKNKGKWFVNEYYEANKH